MCTYNIICTVYVCDCVCPHIFSWLQFDGAYRDLSFCRGTVWQMITTATRRLMWWERDHPEALSVQHLAGEPIESAIQRERRTNSRRNTHEQTTRDEWRTKMLTTRNGRGQSGWSPIGCEGSYFHAMCKNRVSVSGWSPIGCEGFNTNLNISSPLPTILVFSYSCRLLRSYSMSMSGV